MTFPSAIIKLKYCVPEHQNISRARSNVQKPAPRLDDVDRRILDLLEEDGRRTIAEVADRVHLSPAPVKRRIDRLEAEGVIMGYTARIDRSKFGPYLDAFVELHIAGDAESDVTLAEVASVPEVDEVHTIAGDTDALIRIRVDSVAHLKDAVGKIRRIGDVTGTKTLIVMDSWQRGPVDRSGG